MRRGGEPVTPERIERALCLVAYLVARDDEGEVYLPILDRLEGELRTIRMAESPRERARRLLQMRMIPPEGMSRIRQPSTKSV